MTEMDCGRSRECLSQYLDERLSQREMRWMAAHLEGCSACRAEFDGLRVTKTALQHEPVPPPAAGFWTGMHARVREECASLPAPRPDPGAWLRALGQGWRLPKAVTAAAVAAGLVLAVLSARPGHPPAARDEIDSFIAQHAEYSAARPLGDWPRMTFVSSEINAAGPGE